MLSACEINPKTDSLDNQFLYIDLESVVKGSLVKRQIIEKDGAPSRAQRVLKENDILYQCVRPYQLNNYIFEGDKIQCVASTGYAQLRTTQFPLYIFQALHTKRFTNQVLERCTGTNYPAINSSDLGTVEVPICSLPEQVKIGSLLALIDSRIKTQSKIIEEQETLLRSLRHKIYSRVQAESQCTIADVLCYEQPTKYLVTDTDYTDDDSQVPVLTANKAFILGYTTENFGIYDKGPCIILDDFTLDCKYVDFKFKVKSSAIKILRAKAKTNLRFIFEYFRFLALNTTEHRRHYIAEIEPMSILLPSNEEIDRIARLFTALDERLEAARKELKILESQKMYMLQKMFI